MDNILCEDAGLEEPETIEKCGNIECPKWTSTDWSACQKSKCFAMHTALQKRDVNCAFGNESVSDKCDENEKPTTKQECYNELCKGVWRVESWSEVSFGSNCWIIHGDIFFGSLCVGASPLPTVAPFTTSMRNSRFSCMCYLNSQCNAPCSGKGTRFRLLKCVWYGTRKPAGNACNNQPRPAVMKPCSGPPCSVVDRELSLFCFAPRWRYSIYPLAIPQLPSVRTYQNIVTTFTQWDCVDSIDSSSSAVWLVNLIFIRSNSFL